MEKLAGNKVRFLLRHCFTFVCVLYILKNIQKMDPTPNSTSFQQSFLSFRL